jgi:Lanthionine synthetase C-like protein/Protein kinase domain
VPLYLRRHRSRSTASDLQALIRGACLIVPLRGGPQSTSHANPSGIDVYGMVLRYLDLEGLRDSTVVEPPTTDENPFVRVIPANYLPRSQGWKLHVSADEACLEEVLKSTLPLLVRLRTSFKVLGGVESLRRINSGSAGLSQVGKFITVYPKSDSEAVSLAERLRDATQGLRAPVVPSDHQLEPTSIVSYRYGAHQGIPYQTPWGLPTLAIRDPHGNLIEDRREAYPTTPDWASNPFGHLSGQPTPLPALEGRYRRVSLLSVTARHFVSLAIDTLALRGCIIKEVNVSGSRGAAEEVARDGLMREAAVLRAMTGSRGFPTLYDVVESQSAAYIVEEDVGGESLTQRVRGLQLRGDSIPTSQVVAWSREIGELILALHEGGFVYGDLKSDNVLIGDDGHVHLCDFESCRTMGEDATPLMTYGYRPHEVAHGNSAGKLSDIYSVGAILLFLLTGQNPSLYPEGDGRLMSLLSASSDKLAQRSLGPFVEVVARCLQPEPSSRYQDMAMVVEELRRAGREAQLHGSTGPVRAPGDVEEAAHEPVWDLRRRIAAGLAAICADAIRVGNDEMTWKSFWMKGKGGNFRDINAGAGGTLTTLCDGLVFGADDGLTEFVIGAAKWLSKNDLYENPPLPGLYVGDCGVGLALLRAGILLDDGSLLERGQEMVRRSCESEHKSPDLFSGLAGRARALLRLWEFTGDPADLARSEKLAQRLLEAEESGSGMWRFPADFGPMSGELHLGYAHGAAGIGDALLDLYRVTGGGSYLAAAQRVVGVIDREGRPILPELGGIAWPTSPGGPLAGPFWCHGTVGIGLFLLHGLSVPELEVDCDLPGLVRAAARSVAATVGWHGPTLCHGLAGAASLFLELSQQSGDRSYLAQAAEVLDRIGCFQVSSADGLTMRWTGDTPTDTSPDFLVGYAGVLSVMMAAEVGAGLSFPARLGKTSDPFPDRRFGLSDD